MRELLQTIRTITLLFIVYKAVYIVQKKIIDFLYIFQKHPLLYFKTEKV